MALFGPFAQVRDQIRDDRFTAAMAYAAEMLRPGSAAQSRIGLVGLGQTERIELAAGVFALDQAYEPKQRPDGFFESHRRYIDVQVIVAGEELMEVEDISRLTVALPYNPERDFIKYADTAVASVLRMRTGDVAIFYPEDGHMPSLYWRGSGLVRKTVVKVPVA